MLKTDASLSIRRITTKSWKILLCAVGLILAWQALRGVAWNEVRHLLGKIDFRVIFFLTALNLLMLPLMNARWWLFLRMLDKRVGLLSLCAYRTAANTVSYLTPGPHFGGEPLSVYLLVQRHLLSASAATASVAVVRLLELLASFGVLALCVASLAFTEADPFKGAYYLLPIVAVFLLCLIIRLRDVIFSLFGSGLLLNYLTCHKKVPIIGDI